MDFNGRQDQPWQKEDLDTGKTSKSHPMKIKYLGLLKQKMQDDFLRVERGGLRQGDGLPQKGWHTGTMRRKEQNIGRKL